MVDGDHRGPGSPGIPRASSGGGMTGGQSAAGTPGKTATGGALIPAAKVGAQSLHKARYSNKLHPLLCCLIGWTTTAEPNLRHALPFR